MKIRTATSVLVGPALDWAVAQCEGDDYCHQTAYDGIGNEYPPHRYSSDWNQGGVIIFRERIGTVPNERNSDIWIGSIYHSEWKYNQTGATPLIAAMRCYVAFKLGFHVDVPEEILQLAEAA